VCWQSGPGKSERRCHPRTADASGPVADSSGPALSMGVQDARRDLLSPHAAHDGARLLQPVSTEDQPVTADLLKKKGWSSLHSAILYVRWGSNKAQGVLEVSGSRTQ